MRVEAQKGCQRGRPAMICWNVASIVPVLLELVALAVGLTVTLCL